MTAQFEALKIRFLERCSCDLGKLQQMMRAPDAGAWIDLKTLVHQMSGAAGAFGFARLSTLAMRLDDQLSAGHPPSREHMQALIDDLGAIEG
jgi:HPt (histidine-containing phosphotransfer) domain-containing protein